MEFSSDSITHVENTYLYLATLSNPPIIQIVPMKRALGSLDIHIC